MKLREMLSLGVVAGGVAFANPVVAEAQSGGSALPGIQSVSVQCVMGGGSTTPQILTVQVTHVALVGSTLAYEFRNVATGLKTTYTPVGGVYSQWFPVPTGTYNLTVKQLVGQGPQALWNNIVVPVAVSTNGKGTGCRFLNATETPAGQTVRHN